MASTDEYTNATTITIDLFCIKMPVGPLVWAVFSITCTCVGAPASMWLLWLLIQRQCSSSGSSNNVYMLNLSVMDLIYNGFKLPIVLNFFVWRDSYLFALTLFLEGLFFFGRPFFMACSCVDCYMAVVYPIKYLKTGQSRYRLVVCALVWALTLLLSILLCLHYLVNIWYSPCVLAISIIAFCDIAILHTLRKPDPSGRSEVHPQKQRALQTITNSFVMALLSYIPMLLVQMVDKAIPLSQQEVYCHITIPSMISFMLGSTTLPLLQLINLGCFSELRACGCI